MGKKLIVAEKPSVAKDIASALGGFSKNPDGTFESPLAVITSAFGHLVQIGLHDGDDKGWELSALPVIPEKFALQPIEKTKSQLSLISKLSKRADIDTVINACDAGREGELIFRLIYLAIGCKKPMMRMWLQSMTPDAIREAHANMRTGAQMDPLYQSAISRSEADFLVGVNGTRALTKYRELLGKTEGVASAGRVQSPVLALVYDREMAIRNFVPRDFWEVQAVFKAAAGAYDAKWFDPRFINGDDAALKSDRLFDYSRAQAIEEKCRGVAPSSVTEESIPTKSMPPKLYDLTTLQREANTKFGFSAKMTLDLAQALYETHKILTYPRTDSTALPEDYVETAKQTLATYGGSAYAQHAKRVLDNGWVKQEKRVFDNSKITDHFAIIPNGTAPRSLSPDEAKLYDMVVRRFIAVFHPAAEFMKTTRLTIVSGESFKSQGSVMVAEGWMAVYGRELDTEGDKELCRVVPGESVITESVRAVGMKTKEPERYTEATLLGAMANAGRLVEDDEFKEAMQACGLGTPATRAATIEDLLSKGKCYLVREKKFLVPTAKAMEVIELLRSNGVAALTSPELTGEWEYKLDLMAKGKFSRPAFMDEVKAMTRLIVDQIRQKARSVPVANAMVLGVPCPKCKGAVHGTGRFFSCQSCDFKMWQEVAGHQLSKAEAEQLISSGKTDVLQGLVSSKKNKFSARLVFDADFAKVSFEFPEPAAASIAPEARERVGACPLCQANVVVSGEHYDCEKKFERACEFRLWGVTASKRIDAALAEKILTHGRSGLLDGLRSSKGKSFSADLVLNKDGKIEFEFEKRL